MVIMHSVSKQMCDGNLLLIYSFAFSLLLDSERLTWMFNLVLARPVLLPCLMGT